MKRLPWMYIIWPSFLVACCLEMVVFVMIDPADMHASTFVRSWSAVAIYSSAFFLFWLAAMTSSALTAWLARGTDDTAQD
jgi:hypothetical protein